MGVTIREATLQDYTGLCELFAEIDALHAQALPHVFQTVDGPARSRAYLRSLLEGADSALFVAEQKGKLVGMVDVRVHSTPDIPIMIPRRYAMIDAIVVRKTHRHSGIGRALMEHAHEWARGQGVDEIALNVWEFNAGAIAFYEGLGYTTVLRRMWRRLGEQVTPSARAESF